MDIQELSRMMFGSKATEASNSTTHFYGKGGLNSDNGKSDNNVSLSIKANGTENKDKQIEDKVAGNLKSLRDAGDHCKVLYVERLPIHLANPDVLFAIFEKLFGKVDKIKLLAKQQSTALVQMRSNEDAKKAILQQEELKKIDRSTAEVFIKFCITVKDINIGREDERSRDYTKEGGGGSSNRNYHDSRRAMMEMNSNRFPQGFPSSGWGPMMNRGIQYDAQSMYGSQQQGFGSVLFVSRLPEDITNPDAISNLLGVYGDVNKVQMIKNGSSLVEMATPQQASNVRNYLDQVKIGDKKIIVNNSNKPSIRQMNENQETFKDYTRSGIHRFHGLKPGHKMLRSFYRPSAELFVSRFDAEKSDSLKTYFEKSGYTVKDVKTVGQKGDMAIVSLDSVEEGIKALAKLHNTMPEDLGEKKGKRGLCLNFAMSSSKKRRSVGENKKEKESIDDSTEETSKNKEEEKMQE